VSYGDWIKVEGEVAGGKIKKAQLIGHKTSGQLLIKLRVRILSFIKRSLGSTDAALVSGMVLGSGELISESFWESLTRSGTAHVVVASGFNVTLVSGFTLSFLLLILNRKSAVIFSGIFIWLYIFIAGFDAPLVRAGILGTLFLFSQFTGRKAHTVRLLILTGFIMILVKPLWIVDLGFLLSFGATLSLILFASKVYRLLRFVPNFVRGDLATSLAAQVGVAPLLYLSFGQLNILSPFINALVLWTTGAITVLGIIAVLTSLISERLGYLILLLEYPLTKYFIFVVTIFSK
jgi:competence protein ComEC